MNGFLGFKDFEVIAPLYKRREQNKKPPVSFPKTSSGVDSHYE
jgi:hypothetical protein